MHAALTPVKIPVAGAAAVATVAGSAAVVGGQPIPVPIEIAHRPSPAHGSDWEDMEDESHECEGKHELTIVTAGTRCSRTHICLWFIC